MPKHAKSFNLFYFILFIRLESEATMRIEIDDDWRSRPVLECVSEMMCFTQGILFSHNYYYFLQRKSSYFSFGRRVRLRLWYLEFSIFWILWSPGSRMCIGNDVSDARYQILRKKLKRSQNVTPFGWK